MSLLLASAVFFQACGLTTDSDNALITYTYEKQENEKLSMESSPVLEYELPEMLPGVLVDRKGYCQDEVKYALCYSTRLPEKYCVLDVDTEESVYIGTPEEIQYDGTTGIYSARLPFENIPEDGRYYIFAESIGSSYSFDISGSYYRDIYWNLINSECEKIKDGNAELWEVYSLLYTFERYKDVLYALKEDAPDVLGAVGEWIGRTDFDSFEGTDGYIAIAILAKFGYNYNTVEEKLATECIQKASAMYKKVGDAQNTAIPGETASQTGERADAGKEGYVAFLALVELYRTSAIKAYADELYRMSETIEAVEDLYSSKYLLYGAMGYMTTRHPVDRDFCDVLMETLLYNCRDMNEDRTLYEVDGIKEKDPEELLLDAQKFAAMNYILDGYEYNENIINIVHYLSGRNSDSCVYDLTESYPSDAIAVFAWLAWLENNGKLDPSAPVIWNYSW